MANKTKNKLQAIDLTLERPEFLLTETTEGVNLTP